MKERILTIDMGNSKTNYLTYDLEGHMVRRVDVRSPKQALDVDVHLNQLPEDIFQDVCAISWSCVVPAVAEVYYAALSQKFKGPIYTLAGQSSGLSINNPNPNEVGADMVASALAGIDLYPGKPLQIIDMGSANKISVILEDGFLYGCSIGVGIRSQIQSLHRDIPHLPEIPLTLPDRAANTRTIPCLQAGILLASIEGLMGLSQVIDREFQQAFVKLFTGGFANLYQTYPHGFIPYENLVNRGLWLYGKRSLHHEK